MGATVLRPRQWLCSGAHGGRGGYAATPGPDRRIARRLITGRNTVLVQQYCRAELSEDPDLRRCPSGRGLARDVSKRRPITTAGGGGPGQASGMAAWASTTYPTLCGDGAFSFCLLRSMCAPGWTSVVPYRDRDDSTDTLLHLQPREIVVAFLFELVSGDLSHSKLTLASINLHLIWI